MKLAVQKDDFPGALKCLDLQLQKTPHHVPSLYTRANLNRFLGKTEEALADIKIAVQFNDPSESEIFASTLWLHGAQLYALQEDWENALVWYGRAYDAAVKDNPDRLKEIAGEYAPLLLKAGREEDALRIVKESGL